MSEPQDERWRALWELVEKLQHEAQEAREDGDFCCAETRFNDAEMIRDTLLSGEPPTQENERAFRAGFQAGLNAIGKFGEQWETADEAWTEYLKEKP